MEGQERSGRWADGPLKLINTPKYQLTGLEKSNDYVEAASTMAVIHNIILRGLNSIYLQARNVVVEDNHAFIGYCICWYEVIDSHHKGEELFFFPKIEGLAGEKGLMDKNVAQHDTFHEGIEAFHLYLTSLVGKERTFSGVELVRIIDTFSDALATHLSDEILSLLELSRFGDKIPILNLGQTEGRRSAGGISKTTSMIFFFLNHDLTYENGLWESWPPVPPIVRWIMIRILASRHARWWKFASCDYNGRPQKLFSVIAA